MNDFQQSEEAAGSGAVGLARLLHLGDIVLVSDLSRLGRSLLEVMSILYTLMEKEQKISSEISIFLEQADGFTKCGTGGEIKNRAHIKLDSVRLQA